MNDKNRKDEGKIKNKNSSSNPNIVTLDSIRSNEDSNRQAFFAGGSLSSGQQILGNDSNNPNLSHVREQLLNTFRAASVRNDQGRSQDRPFSGTGHKLGSTESVTDETCGSSQDVTDQPRPVNVTLKLWENGYSVDDGPLSSYDGQNSNDIIKKIVSGLSTANLLNPHIDLTVIDNTSQQHKETLTTFGGTGYVLGGLSPTLTTNVEQGQNIGVSSRNSCTDCISDEGDVDMDSGGNVLGGNIDRECRKSDLISSKPNLGRNSRESNMNRISNEENVDVDMESQRSESDSISTPKGRNVDKESRKSDLISSKGNSDSDIERMSTGADSNKEQNSAQNFIFGKNDNINLSVYVGYQDQIQTEGTDDRISEDNPVDLNLRGISAPTESQDRIFTVPGQTRISMLAENRTHTVTYSSSSSETINNPSNKEEISAIMEESQNGVMETIKNSSTHANDSSSNESIYPQQSAASNPLDGLPEEPLSEEYVSSLDFEDVPIELDRTGNFGGLLGYILESQQTSPDNLQTNISVGGRGNRRATPVMFNVSSRTDFSDGSERIIMLKIRLPNGQTVQLTVNASSVISQVKEYIKQCIPNLANTIFSLYLIYPKRELQNEEPVDSDEISNSVLNIRM